MLGSSTTHPVEARISSALDPTRNRCCLLGMEIERVVVVDFCERTMEYQLRRRSQARGMALTRSS